MKTKTFPLSIKALTAQYAHALATGHTEAALALEKTFARQFPQYELFLQTSDPGEHPCSPGSDARLNDGKSDGPHKFSSTQINLADVGYTRTQGPLEPKVRAMTLRIDAADLAEDGIEDRPHITVKYGLHTDDVEEVRRVVESFGSVPFTLGRTSIFSGEEYDVVKIDVVSDRLYELNKLISASLKCTDTHLKYIPHCTLAYVKPGLGKKYAGWTDVEGLEGNATEVIFSNTEKQKTSIDLVGVSTNELTESKPEPDMELWEKILAMMPRERPATLPITVGEIDGVKITLVDGNEVMLRPRPSA